MNVYSDDFLPIIGLRCLDARENGSTKVTGLLFRKP